MGWDLAESRAEACASQLMRINALGICFEGRTGRFTTMFSWVARP